MSYRTGGGSAAAVCGGLAIVLAVSGCTSDTTTRGPAVNQTSPTGDAPTALLLDRSEVPDASAVKDADVLLETPLCTDLSVAERAIEYGALGGPAIRGFTVGKAPAPTTVTPRRSTSWSTSPGSSLPFRTASRVASRSQPRVPSGAASLPPTGDCSLLAATEKPGRRTTMPATSCTSAAATSPARSVGAPTRTWPTT